MKRAPSVASSSSLSFRTASKAVAVVASKSDVDSELEKALLSACAEGDVERSRQVIEKIQRKQDTTVKEAIEELFACAFARAASCNHVAVMEFFLTLSSSADNSFHSLDFAINALRYGICRSERHFPAVESQMQCCFALRYVGYAAVMCVKYNAVSAMHFLIERELLEDIEVVRCFAFAKQKAIRFDAPNPSVYRPLLMLLIKRFPRLLQISTPANAENNAIIAGQQRNMRALESTLVYEYKLNQVYSSAAPTSAN